MESLNNLALKGHFESLREKYSESKSNTELAEGLMKAVELIESFYESHKELFNKEHILIYNELVQLLQSQNVLYNGHPDLMDDQLSFDKKPMQKAGKKAKAGKSNRKTG